MFPDGNGLRLPFLHIMEFDEAHFTSSAPLLLRQDEIHLWQAITTQFEARCGKLELLLSYEELCRMKKFHFPKDRVRFAAAHGILRMLAGRYLNLSPRLLNFSSSSLGKPAVAGNTSEPIFFNISHSHDIVVLAFARVAGIGVDVEYIRPIPDWQQIVDSCFHQKERAVLQNIPLCDRCKAFYECWTRKEAFIKATGEGLNRPLHSFFTFRGDEKAGRIYHIGGDGLHTGKWRLAEFIPAPQYAGAVAFELLSLPSLKNE